MHLYEDNVLNLRIKMPITYDLSNRNFITKIISYKKICSNENSISVVLNLIPNMYVMMLNNNTGTFNFTNPGTISHNIIDNTLEEQNEMLMSKQSIKYY